MAATTIVIEIEGKDHHLSAPTRKMEAWCHPH